MRWITIILLLALVTTANAQSNTNSNLLSLFSSGDKLIKKALDSSVCLVRQEYNLVSKTSGIKYGRQKKAYYGYSYGVGVITSKGIKTNVGVLNPWLQDEPIVKKYDTLHPQLSDARFKKIAGHNFTEVKGIKPDTITDKSIATYNVDDSLKNWKGINIAGGLKDSTGWIYIIAIKKGETQTDTTALITSAFKAGVARKDSAGISTYYIKNMPSTDQVIGGVYYTCAVTEGRITFCAAGILQKSAWASFGMLAFLMINKKISSRQTTTCVKKESAAGR